MIKLIKDLTAAQAENEKLKKTIKGLEGTAEANSKQIAELHEANKKLTEENAKLKK